MTSSATTTTAMTVAAEEECLRELQSELVKCQNSIFQQRSVLDALFERHSLVLVSVAQRLTMIEQRNNIRQNASMANNNVISLSTTTTTTTIARQQPTTSPAKTAVVSSVAANHHDNNSMLTTAMTTTTTSNVAQTSTTVSEGFLSSSVATSAAGKRSRVERDRDRKHTDVTEDNTVTSKRVRKRPSKFDPVDTAATSDARPTARRRSHRQEANKNDNVPGGGDNDGNDDDNSVQFHNNGNDNDNYGSASEDDGITSDSEQSSIVKQRRQQQRHHQQEQQEPRHQQKQQQKSDVSLPYSRQRESICTACKQNIDNEYNEVQCRRCKDSYHSACTSAKRMTRHWTCAECASKVANGDDDDNDDKEYGLRKRKRQQYDDDDDDDVDESEQDDDFGNDDNHDNDDDVVIVAPTLDETQQEVLKKAKTRLTLAQCKHIVSMLMADSVAKPFNAPVSAQKYPDYRALIKTPIDFGTIKRRLNLANYTDVAACVADIELVFANCLEYNAPNSLICEHALMLRDIFYALVLDATQQQQLSASSTASTTSAGVKKEPAEPSVNATTSTTASTSTTTMATTGATATAMNGVEQRSPSDAQRRLTCVSMVVSSARRGANAEDEFVRAEHVLRHARSLQLRPVNYALLSDDTHDGTDATTTTTTMRLDELLLLCDGVAQSVRELLRSSNALYALAHGARLLSFDALLGVKSREGLLAAALPSRRIALPLVRLVDASDAQLRAARSTLVGSHQADIVGSQSSSSSASPSNDNALPVDAFVCDNGSEWTRADVHFALLFELWRLDDLYRSLPIYDYKHE